MGDDFWAIIRLNTWLVLGFFLAILVLLPKEIFELVAQLLGLFNERWDGIQILADLPLGYIARIPLALAFIVAGFLLQYYRTDYSAFFPSHLAFNMYFNPTRLAIQVDQFSPSQLAHAHIELHPDWRQLRPRYLQDRNEKVREIDSSCTFEFADDNDGRGYFSFAIAKMKTGAPQTYETDPTSFGIVDFNSHPDGDTETLMARFGLVEDSYQEFHVSISDLARFHGRGRSRYLNLRRYLIARPRFAQTAYVNLTTRKSVGSIVALSRVQFFPTVSLVSTIYLVDFRTITASPEKQSYENSDDLISSDSQELTTMIPIAYAVYR